MGREKDERLFHIHSTKPDNPDQGICLGVTAVSAERAVEMVLEIGTLANGYAPTVECKADVTDDSQWQLYEHLGLKHWLHEDDMERLRQEARDRDAALAEEPLELPQIQYLM